MSRYNVINHNSSYYPQELEKAMAPHSSTLAWKTPWTEEPGGLQSMGSLRVGHDWATSLSRIREGNGSPLQCSCLENPRGAWWAAVYGVTQSWTRLKRLSSNILKSCHSSNQVFHKYFLKKIYRKSFGINMILNWVRK